MTTLDRLINLNIHYHQLGEIHGTGNERAHWNEIMLEQERILKSEIGEAGFDEVIDAIVDFIEGKATESDIRKVYAKWT